MRQFFMVAERGVAIPVTREHLLFYSGPSQIIASALMFRLFCQALDELSPERPPERTCISFLTAFPGQGILDCMEYVSRSRTLDHGRLVIAATAGPLEAPKALPGRLYFEVSILGHGRAYWPAAGYFDDVFLDMVARFEDGGGTPEQQTAYTHFKHKLAARILAAPEQDLFVSRSLKDVSQALG